MKNKYLTKCLCITMISAMVFTGSMAVFAEGNGETFESGGMMEDESGGQTLTGNPKSAAPVSLEPTVPVSLEPTVPAASDSAASVSPAPTAPAQPSPQDPPVTDPTPGPEIPDTEPVPGGPEVSPIPVPPEPSVSPAPPDPTMTPIPTDPTVTPIPTDPTVTPTPTDPTVTPVPVDPTVTPTPTDPTVTPTPTDPTVTPTPADPTVTPTPTEPTVTPVPPEPSPVGPSGEEKARLLVDRIDALSLTEITLENKAEIQAIRVEYDSLTDSEKAMVTNYQLFVNMENTLRQLENPEEDKDKEQEDGEKEDQEKEEEEIDVIDGMPLYYTDMVSNLHAGKDFYLNSLTENYQLSFSEDFAAVMNEIEAEYKAKNKLTDVSDTKGGVTSSADNLLVRNWQDILAIYIYEQSLQGVTSYTLDASCKPALAAIFEEMNPVVRDEEDITRVTYGGYHINYYIKKNKIAKKDRKVLKKYTETDCKLLCAVVTASKGFIRQSVGDEVAEERVNVIAAAYSLIGKVGYFWGGKSTYLGVDPSWGTVEPVTAAGSRSTGTLRAYGLDCSGFVSWAAVNGYQNPAMMGAVGNGTSDQWLKANVVSEADAQPGDLVFQRGPEAGSNNHVGILCGKTDAGDWIAVHCSASQNGVTVGEAYSAGFRYIRQPAFYPNEEQAAELEKEGRNAANTQYLVSEVTVTNTLQDIILANQNAFRPDNLTESTEGNAQLRASQVIVNNALSGILESGAGIAGDSVFDKINYNVIPETEAVAGPSGENTEAERWAEMMKYSGSVKVNNALQDVLDSGLLK